MIISNNLVYTVELKDIPSAKNQQYRQPDFPKTLINESFKSIPISALNDVSLLH